MMNNDEQQEHQLADFQINKNIMSSPFSKLKIQHESASSRNKKHYKKPLATRGPYKAATIDPSLGPLTAAHPASPNHW